MRIKLMRMNELENKSEEKACVQKTTLEKNEQLDLEGERESVCMCKIHKYFINFKLNIQDGHPDLEIERESVFIKSIMGYSSETILIYNAQKISNGLYYNKIKHFILKRK